MTAANIIETIDEILNLGIAVDVKAGTTTFDTDERCNSLLSCCNFVLEDLYREHAAGCHSTVVEAANGLIDTSDYRICKVISVVDSCGVNVPFKYCADGLSVKRDGRYNLTYAKLPKQVDYAGEIVLPSSVITHRIFIYGVIAEYLRRQGDYNNSAVWTDKFVSAVHVATSLKTNVVMPSRRWL